VLLAESELQHRKSCKRNIFLRLCVGEVEHEEEISRELDNLDPHDKDDQELVLAECD
jgi:hypothetical protein